ncbi:DUF2911 domain-containing protein [Algoriphagus vanfongensis]|uniref:DUF2911 domain-containing protein n=1 Tax=Algoriphagus vanfongensis TaxID=426371 RepID=UPI0004145B60|nr:DUF2911 domain-containing protein [Algoriphagus vanfongensis]
MNFKKSLFSFLLFAGFALTALAQEKASPAMTAEGSVGDAKVTVNYSSPAVKGRMIWGDLVPLGQVWRAGANEATTFTTTKDLLVEGKKLPAGTYSFFIIPDEGQSTFIFNKVAKQWGAFNYDAAEDQLRVNVASGQSSTMEERLKYEVKDGKLVVSWEYGTAAAKLAPAM